MRQHLRCNLLFGLIGHFGLLKEDNISFFLSFFLYRKTGASDIPFTSPWSVTRDESRAKALITRFTDMEKKKAFLYKRMALKCDKIDLDSNIPPALVAHCKENMKQTFDATK